MISIGILLMLLLLFLGLIGVGFYGHTSSQKNFRRRLSGEIEQWLAEGLLLPEQAERLKLRYQLNQLTGEARSLILKTLFLIGALLIAGGVVAFVAAHWEAISKPAKLTGLLVLLAATHGTGFYLWKQSGSSPYLGHALIILGSLIFGGTIGLIAQMFHLEAQFYSGFLVWSIGVAAMAYAVGSVPQIIMAAIAAWVWYNGWLGEHQPGAPLFLVVFLSVFLPFAYRQASRGSHFTTLAVWGAAVLSFMLDRNQFGLSRLLVLAAACLGMFFWSYSDLRRVRDHPGFSDDAKVLAGCIWGLVSYLLSFHDVSRHLVHQSWQLHQTWQWVVVVSLVSLTLGLVVSRSGTRSKAMARFGVYPPLTGLALLIALVAVMPANSWIAGTVVANLAVVGWGVFFFGFGLEQLDRRYFWLGLVLVVLVVLGRFFEYETGLLLKSVAFILAGLILISGGLWFERRKGRENDG